MTYNLTAIAVNSTSMVPFMQNVNTVLMGGMMGIMILIGVITVMFIGFYFATQDTKRSVAAVGLISFGLSIFLRAMGLVSDLALFVCLIISAAALALSFKS